MEKPQDDSKPLKKQLENAETNVTANIERLEKSLESDEDFNCSKTTQMLPVKVSCVNLYLIIRYFIDFTSHRPGIQ